MGAPITSAQVLNPYAAIGARCSAYFTAYAIAVRVPATGAPRMIAYDHSGW
jgi:hypothetical protein